MPRRHRTDYPGAWHHVMNRGIAKRLLFEDRACMRQFLCHVALAVRRGEIRVHSFCLLPNHFHLLVSSPKGQLSKAMQRILNGYSRWFNRRSRRDGTLYRARYLAKPVESMTYRRVLVGYIDDNPVAAGIVDDSGDYPYGSAHAWATGRFPPWLSRDWILEELGPMESTRASQSDSYRSVFGTANSGELRELVERRSERAAFNGDALDDLVSAAPARVRAWMIRKARLADGLVPGQPVTGMASVARALKAGRKGCRNWQVRSGQRFLNAWLLIEVMMLRDLCSLSFPEIGRRLRVTDVTARRHYLRHQQLFESDECYRSVALETVALALRTCHSPSNMVGL